MLRRIFNLFENHTLFVKPKIGLGDEGKTDLIGRRVWKDDLRVEILGKIDELNSFLGLTKSKINED
ncbi:MAG: ATP:cob(I)alamin adenosyltransferase, partial [Candidatus Aenigmarchaeota archaeon]|nr:ATP:cob(I)alamin adenosyltransferase [Candidatus Aenigmarchaeota archaeon]